MSCLRLRNTRAAEPRTQFPDLILRLFTVLSPLRPLGGMIRSLALMSAAFQRRVHRYFAGGFSRHAEREPAAKGEGRAIVAAGSSQPLASIWHPVGGLSLTRRETGG